MCNWCISSPSRSALRVGSLPSISLSLSVQLTLCNFHSLSSFSLSFLFLFRISLLLYISYDDNDVEEVRPRVPRRHSYDPDATDVPATWKATSEELDEKDISMRNISTNSSGNNLGDVTPGRLRPHESKSNTYNHNNNNNNNNNYNNNNHNNNNYNTNNNNSNSNSSNNVPITAVINDNSSSSSSSSSSNSVPINASINDNIKPKIDSTHSQQEHRDEMAAMRKQWQEEIEFHEASVRRQRIAMQKEKEQMILEQDTLRQQQSTVTAGILAENVSNVTRDSKSFEDVSVDLRLKLRELEGEMDEMKSINIRLEDQLVAAQRLTQREKKVNFHLSNIYQNIYHYFFPFLFFLLTLSLLDVFSALDFVIIMLFLIFFLIFLIGYLS